MASSSFLNDGNSKSTSIKRELLRLCIVHQSYSIADFSKALGISVPTLVRLLKSGEIPCRRGGQRWLIAQSVLDDWLKQKS